MEPVSVLSTYPGMKRVLIHYVMLSVRIIRIQDKELWGVKRGGKRTSRVSRGNRNGSWKRMIGISGYFVRAGTIINGNRRETQSWANTINWKEIIEAVIKCPIVVFSH